MVKTFKNILLQNRECLGAQSLHKSSGTRGLPKLLKELSYIDIWPFTAGSSLLPYAFVWAPYIWIGKLLRILNFFFSEATEPICSTFILCLLKSGERKIAKMVAVGWPRWLPCPYMVGPFKNLLPQNWGCLGAKSVHKSSGTGDLPKLLKRLSYVDIWPFYGKVKFASLCICMSPITFIWENCWEFDDFSEATEPNLLRFLAHLSMKCAWWAIVVSQCPSSIMGHAAWTIALKAYSSYTPGPIDSILGRKHRGEMYIKK